MSIILTAKKNQLAESAAEFNEPKICRKQNRRQLVGQNMNVDAARK